MGSKLDSGARCWSKTAKTWTLRIRERVFLRWKEKRTSLKHERISDDVEDSVWRRVTSERSTGDRNASSDGDCLRREDANIAESVAM